VRDRAAKPGRAARTAAARRALLVACAAAGVAASAGAAAQNRPGACTPRFLFVPNGVTDVQGSTFSGRICGLNLGRNFSVLSVEVRVKPAHGVLGRGGERGGRETTAYRPNPGYRGPDRFEIEVVYRTRFGPRRTLIRVHMSVV
jgi:hypothetical protein